LISIRKADSIYPKFGDTNLSKEYNFFRIKQAINNTWLRRGQLVKKGFFCALDTPLDKEGNLIKSSLEAHI